MSINVLLTLVEQYKEAAQLIEAHRPNRNS